MVGSPRQDIGVTSVLARRDDWVTRLPTEVFVSIERAQIDRGS
jgi:hypothetical protein